MNSKNVVNDSLLIPQQQIMNSSEGESKVHIEYQPQGKYDYSQDPSLNGKAKPVPIYRVFRFADRWDILLMIIGFACSIGSGAGIVLYANPYGDLIDAFAPGADRNVLVEKTKNAVFGFLKNSILVFFSTWVMNSVWTISSQRQAIRCRIEYFKGLLKQQPAWHDRQPSSEVADRMYSQTKQLHGAIGSNLSSFIMSLNMVLSGMVVSLTKGWKMALVMMSLTPIAVCVLFITRYMDEFLGKKTNKIMDRATGSSTQVLQNIRTVKALGGQTYQVDNYMLAVEQFTRTKLCFEWLTYFVNSISYWVILLNYCLGFWFASYLVGRGQYNDNTGRIYTAGDSVAIFFIVYSANLTIGNVINLFRSLDSGCRAAGKIYSVLDRKSLIVDGENECPVINQINFKNVTFHYDTPLFENVSFKIKRGRTAFVGESGSGKSTTVSLIMRFYDPYSGTVNFNDLALPQLTLGSLREAIGYVGQEPVLIGKTIRQALLAQKRTDLEIIRALKAAQAWTFVKDIGIDSQFGQLSGGQKQRIAIARALIKSPQILILDEATSALDRTNQQQIQQTIDKLDVSFVIMIAHKIQTIAKADWIYVLDQGKIIQQGTFDQLLQDTQGRFYQLAKNQRGLQQKKSEQQQAIDFAKKQSVKQQQLLLLQRQKSQKQQQQKKKQFKCSYICYLFKLNYKNLPAFIGALICCSFVACVFPLFSYYIANEIVILSNLQYRPESERPYYYALSQEIAYKLFFISVAGYIAYALKNQFSSITYNELNTRLKRQLYTKLTKMKMTHFDKNGSSSGLLNDSGEAAGLGSHTWTNITESISGIVCGLTIAFYHCWEITLVSLGVIPFILIAAQIQMHFRTSFGSKTDDVNKKCHGEVVQALINYKTVVSFNLQHRYQSMYQRLLDEPLKIAAKSGNITGISFGLAQAVISCTLAAIFYVSSLVIRDRNIGVLEVYIAIYAVMFATMNTGGNLGFIGGIANSKIALANVMHILESDEVEETEQGAVATLHGRIEFKNVVFKYPQRKGTVLNGVSFVIQPGQKVAFVGSSGCGKSTAISLLLRLYEPVSGEILVDDRPITEYNLKHLRLGYGVVTQQPVLFNRSIYENIRYNNLSLTLDEVVAATKKANAFDFIMAGNFGLKQLNQVVYDLEGQEETRGPEVQAFSRKVGNRGSFLSGGQKQRVAVARAIARNPSIMLLDEATSALDSKNEEEVQTALDNITGITQVVVAHRLSTIKNCDKILVFNQGQIIEQGTFEQLIEIRGYFFKLAQGQAKQDA